MSLFLFLDIKHYKYKKRITPQFFFQFVAEEKIHPYIRGNFNEGAFCVWLRCKTETL